MIILPGRWSGDPCICVWGGQHHVYTNNTCIVSDDSPLAIDSDVEGSKCIANYSDANSAAYLPALARNTYHTSSGGYEVGCDAPYSLAQLQALGQELGSIAIKGYTVSDVTQRAALLLGVAADSDSRY